MEPLSLTTYIILFFAGGLAGFVDSIAGGGGLISVPTLLACGIPPHLALGTNKLQSSFGSFTATVNYCREGLAEIRQAVPGIVFTAVGAAAGTFTIQLLPTDFLNYLIPVLLIAVFFYTLFSPQFGVSDRLAAMPVISFFIVFGLGLGFYDGFFGPGTGSFWAVAFVMFLGNNLKKATAYTKIMNFTSNIVSLTAFVIGGNVLFSAGIVMGAGQLFGAVIGSTLMIRKGVRFIRIFFLSIVALTIMKLTYSTLF